MEELSRLIKECAAGKTKAQNRLYQLYAPRLFGVCLRYSRDQAGAEDNLHEGFMKIFEKIGTYRHEGSFEGWMRRIMVNISLDKYRRQQVVYAVEDISLYELPQWDDEIISEISANDLMALVQKLPTRYRMVFNLYVLEGMNHKEISQEMNISEGTSKSNLARARMILKKKVEDFYEEQVIKTNEKRTKYN